MSVPESWIYREPSSGSVSSNSGNMSFLGDITGFGSMLSSFMDTAVSSSDRRAANELNYWAQMDTNKTNAQINADQLAWAKELYRLQKAENRFLVDQAYERELENRSYNSPQNMKEMYLRAGINPYLASQSGIAGGSHGSVNPSVGSPPSGQVPGSIPMQAAHFEPTMPNGLGLRDALEMYQMSLRNESDMSAVRQRVANETAETKAKIKSMGINDDESKKIIKTLEQQILFNDQSHNSRLEAIELGNEKMRKEMAGMELNMKLQQSLADSAISLNNAQKSALGSQIKLNLQEIAHIKNADQLSSAEVRQRVISMINQDASLFESLGMSKEMMASQKFKNYVGSIVDAVGTAAAVYFGVRRGVGSVDVPNKPDSYLKNLNGYAPWSY